MSDENEQMDSFLDVDTSGAVEPVAADAGEYQLRVTGGIIDTDKNSHPYFMPYFEIPSEPHSKSVSDFFGLPYDGKPEKDLNNDNWKLETFKQCFGVSGARIDLKEIVGLDGWAVLGKKESSEYGEQNNVRKYIAPK